MTIAIGSASVIVNFIFLFFLRLIGILDPQWHFGSTLANQLALLYFARSVVVCVYILVFATSLPLRTAVGFSYMTYSRPQLQRVKLGNLDLPLPCNRPAELWGEGEGELGLAIRRLVCGYTGPARQRIGFHHLP